MTNSVWGSFDSYPARYGVARYRLVVFPPGITVRERRMVKVWRSWPLWGAALWLVLQLAGEMTGMSATALIAGTMLYIAAGAITFAVAGETRMRVRTLWAVKIAGLGDDEADPQYSHLRLMARALVHADLDLLDGRISAVEHEARWWQVYDLLDAMTSSAPSWRASHTPSAISPATSKPAIPRSTNPSGINVHHR